MPVYEYRCRTCDTDFELRRPMAESTAPASCPDGHPGALRRMSVVSTIGGASAAVSSSSAAPGAPCGAGCACH